MAFKNGKTYRFINRCYAGFALNVFGTSAASTGRNVCLYANDPTDIMQDWVVKERNGGYRLHSAVNQSYVLDCSDGSMKKSYKNNAHLCITSQTTDTDSKVLFERKDNNIYKIYLPGKNLYLTATNSKVNASTGYPASSIENETALTGGTGGESNVYWAKENTNATQEWIVSPDVDGGTIPPDPRPGEFSKNYFTYPVKKMKITQPYNSNSNHQANFSGTPNDYPIDEACEDYGKSPFYCPCDEMVVVRTRVKEGATSGIWLESTSPVVTPSGTYPVITLMILHPDNEEVEKLEGRTFSRGAIICHEGKEGNATGNHFHISVGTGKYNGGTNGNGWQKNSAKAWVLTPLGKTLKPEEAFFVDPTFTTIINSNGIHFSTVPSAN